MMGRVLLASVLFRFWAQDGMGRQAFGKMALLWESGIGRPPSCIMVDGRDSVESAILELQIL